MRLTHVLTPTAASLALLCGAVMAAEPPASPQNGVSRAATGGEAEFGTLDTNANHLIDRSEAKASKALESNFDQLDQNHDGQLSESEFSGFEKAHPGPAVSPAQTNAVKKSAKPTEPRESWFTSPEHKPRDDDEPSRGRTPR